MAHQDERTTMADYVLDRRQRGLDALVVGHNTVGHRHVEVHSHEDVLALEADVADGHLVQEVTPGSPPSRRALAVTPAWRLRPRAGTGGGRRRGRRQTPATSTANG